jgi:hypothetical protein
LFLGSGGLFSPLWPLKVYIFFIYIKFLIDRYITRPYWFWNPNSVFGLWGPIFTFMTPESIYFLDLYRISDRLRCHMLYFIFEPPVPSLGIRRIPNFFEIRTQHQITKCSAFLDFFENFKNIEKIIRVLAITGILRNKWNVLKYQKFIATNKLNRNPSLLTMRWYFTGC